MRDFKFRVFIKRKRKPSIMVTNLANTLCFRGGELKGIFDDKNIFIMQYTGLVDNHKKEIYEGDIVKLLTTNFCEEYKRNLISEVGQVMWLNGSCEYWVDLEYKDNDNTDRDNPIDFLKLESSSDNEDTCGADEIEVIGNIYENPELLKIKLDK